MIAGGAALGALALLFAALGLLYAPAIAGMKAMWDATPMYSFGYVVPFVSAYLAWTRRDALAAIVPRADRAGGLAVLAAALALLVAGRVASLQIAEQLSFVLALVAAVLLIWGRAALRVLWMPLAYLLLMVPFWDAFTEPLHAPFQQLSARIGVRLLQAFGVPVYHEGLFIYLPNVTLQVARACSGVNYLVAVLALGVPLAYLYIPSLWRRVALVSSAIVVAALSNGLRVALIAALAYGEIGTPLHGPAHVLHGLFVSAIGFVVLLGGLRVLAPREPASPAARPDAAPGAARTIVVPVQRTIATALVFGAAWLALALYRPVPVPLERPLATLPPILDEWRAVGTDTRTAPWWRDADDTLRRTYASPDGTRVEVAIGYFAEQRQGREAASHLMGPLHRAAVGVAPLSAGAPGVNRVRLPAPTGPRDGVFWYEVDGGVVASQTAAKLATARGVLTTRESAGLVVVVLGAEGAAGRDGDQGRVEALAQAVERALRPIVWPDGRAGS